MKFPVAVSLRSRSPRVGAMLGLGLAGVLTASAVDWQSLSSNSPFGQPPPAAVAPTGELEFRGVVREEDIVLVNIFNTSTQKSQWIPLQGEVAGISADSYDEGSDKVKVTSAGKTLTLSLKQSRVALVQMAAPPPPPANGEGGIVVAQGKTGAQAGAPPQPVAGPRPDSQQAFSNLPPEAKSMIEEIRRRRALRAQQAQQRDNAPAQNVQAAQPLQPR